MPEETAEPTKKSGKMKKLMIGTFALLVIGGGSAAGGFYFAGSADGLAGEAKPDYPKLVMKDGTLVDAPGTGTGVLKDTAKYQITYHPIEGSFTSNLRGGSGFAQAEMAVSTYYDERVIAALTEHDIAIRNAVVLELAESDGMTLESVQGKKDLARRLRGRINDVLVQKTGFGGIDDVYFTKLVLQ